MRTLTHLPHKYFAHIVIRLNYRCIVYYRRYCTFTQIISTSTLEKDKLCFGHHRFSGCHKTWRCQPDAEHQDAHTRFQMRWGRAMECLVTQHWQTDAEHCDAYHPDTHTRLQINFGSAGNFHWVCSHVSPRMCGSVYFINLHTRVLEYGEFRVILVSMKI